MVPEGSRAARLEALDPTLDLEAKVGRLRHERNAVLPAHYYQEDEVQDLADIAGDSLALPQAAAWLECGVIAFAGTRLTTETAKLLNPDKIVVGPDLEAGCSPATPAL